MARGDMAVERLVTEVEDAVLIPVVEKIDDKIFALAGGRGSSRGTGGMLTKVQAARFAAEGGIPTVIMSGENPDDLYKLYSGRQTGTLFLGE